MGKWEKARVGDLFELVTGYAFKSQEFKATGVPVIKIKNVKAGGFSKHEFSYVDKKYLSERANKVAQKDDLLISMSGNRHDGSPETWVGKVCHFGEDRHYLINQRVGALRLKKNRPADVRFFAFLLSGMPYQQIFIAIATSSGGQANLSPAQILGAPIRYPNLMNQRRIGEILGILNDKVELNRRMNETLEAMARAIFKDWFVDFGPTRAKAEGRAPYLAPELWNLFPATLDNEDKPVGWKMVPLGERIEILDSRRIPLSSQERKNRQGPYPYHGATGVMDHVDDFLFDGIHVLLGEDGSVVKSTGQPFTQYVWGQFWVNNHAHVLVGNGISNEMLLCFLQQTDVAPYVTGAVQPKLNQRNLKSIPFSASGSNTPKAFERMVGPLYVQFRQNSDENRALTETRDLLLPKLMSGEIRLQDAEKVIEAVA